MKHTATQFSIGFIVVAVLNTLCFGQVATGNQPFNSYGGGPFDSVNLGNLNVHLAIPILHKAGRGMPFIYDLSYDSSIWTPVGSGSSKSWQPAANYGWLSPYGGSGGYLTTSSTTIQCTDSNGHPIGNKTTVSGWAYHDQWGIVHSFGGQFVVFNGSGTNCTGTNINSFVSSATDGSGYVLNANRLLTTTVTTPSGRTFIPSGSAPTGPTSTTVTDANGNQISQANVSGSGVFTDTLGQPALTVGGTNPVTFQYTPPNGTPVSYKVNYGTFNVKTNFGCSGVGEFSATGVLLVSSISLPDGNSYAFTYEPTHGFSGNVTGRLASVTLPTGGSITYSYPLTSDGLHNAINCADGSAPAVSGANPSMTRTLNPGGQWTYARTQVSGNHWQTKITTPSDPQNTGTPPPGNDTVIDFQKDSATTTPTSSFYEVQRQSYQASQLTGTLLVTTSTCWNGNTSSCTTTGVSSPITQQAVTLQYPNNVQSKTVTNYNGSVVSSILQYAFASGTPTTILAQKAFSYAPLGNGIVDHPSSITIADGSGTTVAKTTFTYDEPTLISTGTLPQHISISGSRGNLTTISTQVNGTVTLSRHLTYFDTGTVQNSTDAGTTTSGGPNLTTYSYAGSSCNAGFPTSVSEPLSLSRSFTWDCVGGVMTSVTDENSAKTTTTYSDPDFWRPASIQDPTTATRNFLYRTSDQGIVENYMIFNSGDSISEHMTSVDGFGRPIVSQVQQAPSVTSFDSTETDYDVFGRISRVTVPYVGTSYGQTNSGAPGTVTIYDALSRPLTVTDGGGGMITYSYTANDILQTIGPAATGEHTKQKQLEYDSLGRLISVCEITSVSGSGACGQTNSATGFLTKYTYDAQGNLIGVSQNAQPGASATQSRAYTFDMAGRILTENNPETGSITYTYDTADANCSSYSSPGDLIEKKDAAGNITCAQYDGLHRVAMITYPSGPNASVTPAKFFHYDTAYFGSTGTNIQGRLVAAGTCQSPTSCAGNSVTLLEFGYSARGEVTDVWQSTPNSGGMYHVNASYWAHGKLYTLSGIPSVPELWYGWFGGAGPGLDGEGRYTRVAATTGPDPVPFGGVTYNNSGTSQPIGSLASVTYGSSDSDSFQYDVNTGRMTQYKFSMGSTPQTVTGALTWNANGTLQKLQLTDQINSANSQTCMYGYDDLTRITSANCGSVWSQTFGLDPFGNLSKTGSGQFLPMYNMAKNQYSSIPGGSSTAYDANGNLTNDVTHSYTWDADGNMVSTDGSTVTMMYDAFDRMVEQTRSSGHTQILYGPNGMKLALMNGQTLINAFFKLPGGGTAVFTSSGISYYRHPDHLGSSRLATTQSRTKQYDVAYAPYGEDYNGSGTQDLAFTDQNQDTVKNGWSTNLYDFMLREYRTAHGRWTSPDPARLAAVDPTSPQSWNRYAYVLNDPLRLIDEFGLDGCSKQDEEAGSANCNAGDTSTIQATVISVEETVTVTATPVTADTEDPIFIGTSTSLVDNGKSGGTTGNITHLQCAAAQTLLDRERKYGTTITAWMSAIGFGDNTVQPFNSSVPGQAYTKTALGLVKVDWFTVVNMAGPIPGPQVPAYMAGKLIWTTERLATRAPITNYLPFQDPVESRTMALAVEGKRFSDLFTPAFMKANCNGN